MKKALFLALALLALLSLAACGKKETADEPKTESFETMAALEKELGYTPNSPASLPGKDYTERYYIENKDIVRITYTSADQVVIYRTAKGVDRSLMTLDDAYEEVGKSTCKGFDIPLYGKDDLAHAASWSDDGKSFSIYFSKGLTVEVFDQVLQGT